METHKKHRLIVLIPDYLTNQPDLARQIHWLADRENRSVLLLVLSNAAVPALDTARSVVTLKALASASRFEIESRLVEADQYLDTLREIASPEDEIAFLKGQIAPSDLFELLSVADFLAAPARPGYGRAAPKRLAPWLSRILAVLGFLVIIAAFTWLEAVLDQSSNGALQTILLLTLFSAELGTIVVWNKVTSR